MLQNGDRVDFGNPNMPSCASASFIFVTAAGKNEVLEGLHSIERKLERIFKLQQNSRAQMQTDLGQVVMTQDKVESDPHLKPKHGMDSPSKVMLERKVDSSSSSSSSFSVSGNELLGEMTWMEHDKIVQKLEKGEIKQMLGSFVDTSEESASKKRRFPETISELKEPAQVEDKVGSSHNPDPQASAVEHDQELSSQKKAKVLADSLEPKKTSEEVEAENFINDHATELTLLPRTKNFIKAVFGGVRPP